MISSIAVVRTVKHEHAIRRLRLKSNKVECQKGRAESLKGLRQSLGRLESFPLGFVPPGNPFSRDTKADNRVARAWSLSWSVMVAPASEITMHASHIVNASGAEYAESRETLHSPFASWAKRGLDIMIALAALVLLSPLMIATAIAIRITMGSPVIYAHPRIGMNGRTFRCFKFRTMVNNASEVLERHLAENSDSAWEWRQVRKLARDPRVLGIGHLLRRSSIDELPQLFNVLRGDMSCVGPRPVVAEELVRYGENARDRLSVRPGLTGLWQVSGRNGLSYADRVKLDMLYVRRWSTLLDLAILLKTIPAVMKFDDTA